MKIGIMTFHASYNCGSILQCMALKKVLENKGADVDIINYSSPEQQKLYSVFYKKITLKNMIKNFLCIRGYSKIKSHYNQYRNYIKKVFSLEDKFWKTSGEIRDHISHYDMLVAGGDQVWNVNCDDFSTAYFLDFDNTTYKISYSPSLGATNINNASRAKEYAELLGKFDALSCREKNGRKWLEQLTNRRVELIADPTLLLNKAEWIGQIKDPLKSKISGDYIFYYAFSYSSENNKCVQRIAEEHNLKAIVIDAKQWFIKGMDYYNNLVLCDETGPNTFLSLLNGAKYVITTSFHGTVFSLLFHKRFIYINNKNHEPTDDRTSFLLEQMNLMDHYIYVDDVTWEKLNSSIDYSKIDFYIEDMRSKANDYLDANMKKAIMKGKAWSQ